MEGQGVTKRCRLFWLSNSALVLYSIWAQMRGVDGCRVQPMSTAVHHAHGAQINFGDLTPFYPIGKGVHYHKLNLFPISYRFDPVSINFTILHIRHIQRGQVGRLLRLYSKRNGVRSPACFFCHYKKGRVWADFTFYNRHFMKHGHGHWDNPMRTMPEPALTPLLGWL